MESPSAQEQRVATPTAPVATHGEALRIPRLAVEWVGVNFTVRAAKHDKRAVAPTRHILKHVSGEALPGELMVLMGPSGAGKSSLLDCIANRNPHYSGSVLVNGKPWDQQLARRACYVMQDDLFYVNLAVLEHRSQGAISFMAETVVKQMRQLAHRGRTVIATIHQPSSQIFELFDRLYLLAGGRSVYHGRADASIAYFASVGWPCPGFMNPTDHFMKVLAATDDQPAQAQVVETLVDAWYLMSNADNSESKIRRLSIQVAPSQSHDSSGHARTFYYGVLRWIRQLTVLSRRHWCRLVRDDVIFKARVGSTIFVDLLAGLVFRDLQRDQTGIQDFTGAMFFISVSQLFMYANPELTTVPLEIPLILREHQGGLYHILTWFLAKNLTEVPLQLGLPLLFLVPMYFLIGFDYSATMFFQFYGYTFVAASCATALGYFVSCLARRVDIAPVLGITFMLPFILFGGMFLNSASTPVYFQWLQSISPVMYVFHCLMRVFWPSVSIIKCGENQFCVASSGLDVLAIHGIAIGNSHQRNALLYLAAINVGFRILGGIVLWLRVQSKKPKPVATSTP